MKTLIAIPSMDQVPAQFAQCLATLNKVGECAVSFQIGSLIYTSRNELARKAMEMNADFVFWLDSDMLFDPNTLTDMLCTMQERKDIDFLSGLYFRRVAPFSPVLFDKLEIDDTGCHWTEFEKIPEALFQVGAVGFGCVLIRTEVIMSVMSKFGNMFAPIGNVGEDVSFCWRARQCGYDIWVDPRVSLGHVGHTVITRAFWENYSMAKEALNDNSATG